MIEFRTLQVEAEATADGVRLGGVRGGPDFAMVNRPEVRVRPGCVMAR